MNKPDKVGSALLQARHLYNDAQIEKVIDGGGFTIGKDTLVIRVNRLAWGYFEQAILNAMKERQDLRDWSPELFSEDKQCVECKGAGKFPYTPHTPQYDQAYDDFFKFDGKLEEDAPAYGVEISKFCSPCQGTGITLKPQPTVGSTG